MAGKLQVASKSSNLVQEIMLQENTSTAVVTEIYYFICSLWYFFVNRSHQEVLEYYKKSEKSELKKYKHAPYRGHQGELTVENVPFK